MMRLAEALKIVQSPAPADGRDLSVFLVCGFTPLHVATFLEAYLRQSSPDAAVAVRAGLYGDVAGSLSQLATSDVDAAAIICEWSDFDPRLGLRSLGGWGPRVVADIVREVSLKAARYLELLRASAGSKRLALALPTLPLPAISHQAPDQAGESVLELAHTIDAFAVDAAALPNLRVLNRQRLDMMSPLADRLDVKAEFAFGFPYRPAHASHVASMLARLIAPPVPKKGLITDLDDTLWRGLVGEDGARGVTWSLNDRSHIHGLYQQVLLALAESGVLIAIASKNDTAIVLEALERDDLIMSREKFFPIEAGWGEKSKSIRRILESWNIGADSVVFVDDSPLELAEVGAAYPEIDCRLFPKGDDHAAYAFIEELRPLFGKDAILEEDSIRLQSVRSRANGVFAAAGSDEASTDALLRGADAELTLTLVYDPTDARVLELINKTNQFNLNGRRWTEAELEVASRQPNAFFLMASYKDKYGPLGKISVLLGRVENTRLQVDAWVMSCRALSRRIEHKCLEFVFDAIGVAAINFDFRRTDRNGPLQEFLARILADGLKDECVLDRATFVERAPSLHHHIRVPSHG